MVVLSPRWTVDSRLPEEEQEPFSPTPKQLLYAPRAFIDKILIERDAQGVARAAYVDL